MKSMTLGEFRKITANMPDSAVITISINSNGKYINAQAMYKVSGCEIDEDVECNRMRVKGINLSHNAIAFE